MLTSYIEKLQSRLSIQSKLLVIALSVTTIALVFAVIMAVQKEYVTHKAHLTKSLETQARMVAANTTAALIFDDKKGAEEILLSFSESENITKAVIFNASGMVMASYRKSDEKEITYKALNFSRPDSRDRYIDKDYEISIIQDIAFEGETIGKLFIRADISNIRDEIIEYLVYTSTAALIGLAIASILLLKLRKSIVQPIQRLTELMNTVTRDNDYSIRSDNTSEDEIGMLSQHFNTMLSHIQVNDEKLAHELTERYKAEKHLDKLAYYDLVTDLPNRHFFHERINNAVNNTIINEQQMVLLFLDLDNFKIVNDTLGHKTGDILLKQAASRLSNILRHHDYICRIGGDEFAIIIEDIENTDVTSIVIDKCIEAFSSPFVFDNNKFFIGVSIGVSICPDDATTANDLLVNADIAMYEAKIRGKNNYKFYNHQMNEAHSQRYHLESELRFAIQNAQMELYYQPQIDSKDGSISGIEALMRWNHPVKGVVTPDNFISVAEETGLIISLGQWLINTACMHGKQLEEAGFHDLTVAINISGIQIKDNKFISSISNALNRTQMNPGRLEIELTESTLMNDSEFVIDKLKQMKELGLKIAIDDFGTGYSSMSYLSSFSIDRLKIDRSFISSLPERAEDVAITGAIIAMAHGLGIEVVAEGVENETQAEFLRTSKCDMLQGYHYAMPMPFNDLLELMENKNKKSSKLINFSTIKKK
jgi:diguanylate cyclase (GGDEF)-like protein